MLGKQLKSARLSNNFTQQEVADKLNISRQSISKWENGSSAPDVHTLKMLASFYKTSIQDLTKENEHIERKIETNKHNIHTQKQKFSNIKKTLTKNETDDSWFLLIMLFFTFIYAPLSFIYAPLSFIVIPLVIIKNKKDNHLYKWIIIVTIITTAFTCFVVYGWLSDVFNFGGTITVE